MADIKKAIEIEKYYLECRMKNEYPFHLVDKIKECGFDSLSQYHEEKRDYEFSQLKFEVMEREPSACLTEGWRMVNEGINGILIMETDKTTVYVNTGKPYNEEFCKANNLTVYPLPTGGGTIVSGKDDFAMDICLPKSLGVDLKYMLNKVKDILSKYMDGLEIVDNDILLNGGKICGTTSYTQGDRILIVVHLSFTDNRELIKEICYSSDENPKMPSFITEMNREQFKQEVFEWLQVQ